MSPFDGSQSKEAKIEGRNPKSASKSARLSNTISNSSMLKDEGAPATAWACAPPPTAISFED